ncbi:MAG TPA: rhomboid family intramembrane serine protease [Steroidobacteraceae bacterium]|nr:rhomboid family intramembrane serine protease [Steroidobacteraceae bacterium]
MFGALPPATRTLLLLTIGAFLLQSLAYESVVQLFALWPVGTPLFHPWQVLSYAFLHGSFLHLFLNMFALFMFGRELELTWGAKRFAIFYFACVLAAAATQLAVMHASGAVYPTVGASGGVFGLLLAYAMYFPHSRITLLFPPIPMPAWLFVTLYGIIELVLGVTGTQEGVAHFAHLGGMLGGAALILYWRAARRRA